MERRGEALHPSNSLHASTQPITSLRGREEREGTVKGNKRVYIGIGKEREGAGNVGRG